MRRHYSAFLLLAAAAHAAFDVDEARIRAFVRDGATVVALPVRGGAAAPGAGKLILEYLSPLDGVPHRFEKDVSVDAGASEVTAALPLNDITTADLAPLRLRYRLAAGGVERGGIVAFAHIAAHAFELRLSGPRTAGPGERIRLHVAARHPVTGAPAAGVSVVAKAEYEGGEWTMQGQTGEGGVAVLETVLPEALGSGMLTFDFEAALGDYRRTGELTVGIHDAPDVRIDVDKPLYQPGQTLHVRLLCRLRAGVCKDGDIAVVVEDPEGVRQFATVRRTNRFGVATADWRIPESARLGEYNVTVGDARRSVRIGRYDLPGFRVSAKGDRPYYLPGQDARIDVRAEHLFGRPLAGGRVRVVVESERRWNFAEQKWDVEEGEEWRGVTDRQGRAAARIPIWRYHRQIDSGSRYRDVALAAYVTDPSTRRTEHRRLTVRATAAPIHVYEISSGRGAEYVSTSYADGRPAVCHVSIGAGAVVMTNRYGVARLPAVPDARTVKIVAEDAGGLRGSLEAYLYPRSQSEALAVRLERTLHRAGEPLRLTIRAEKRTRRAVLEVVAAGVVEHSQWVELAGAETRVDVPWRESFQGVVVAGVAAEGSADRAVALYPAPPALSLRIAPERPEYRPGEQTAVDFTVRSHDGGPVESALGVAVVDAAVGERAESGRGRSPSRLGWFSEWEPPELIGGVTAADLLNRPADAPFDADLDLVAEALVIQHHYSPNAERDERPFSETRERFKPYFDRQLAPLLTALNQRYRSNYERPQGPTALRGMLAEAGIAYDALRDPWDRPYLAEFVTDGAFDHMRLSSSGPDRTPGTADDFVVLPVQRAHFAAHRDRIRAVLNALPQYPATAREARSILGRAGIAVDELRDPWGEPYRFRFGIRLDRAWLHFESAQGYTTGEMEGSYFRADHDRFDALISGAKQFPETVREWRNLLAAAKLPAPRDPWGRPLIPLLSRQSQYSDLRRLYTDAKFGGEVRQRVETVPVTVRFHRLRLYSMGPDGKPGTPDDFDLAVIERSYRAERPGETRRLPAMRLSGRGVITGQVTDPSGAVVPGALVSAGGVEARTDEHGLYWIEGLAPGEYPMRIETPGFQTFRMTGVPVSSRTPAVVDATLQLGSVAETVTVAAVSPQLQTSSAMASSSMAQVSTPPVRDEFPETLLWEPSLETGAEGTARVRFRLAGNITTWNVEAMASDERGRVATASAPIRAFQPFFAEHEPPRILTEGDRIDLPVVVRNYLETAQDVTVSIRPEAALQVEGEPERRVRAGPHGAVVATFPMRTAKPVTEARLRVTATGSQAADAVEKPVTVRADGREEFVTRNAVLMREAEIGIKIPKETIKGSVRAELTLYPGISAHVVAAMEGILKRPYGCAEQTISAAYPGLLLLQAGVKDPALRSKALRYLELAIGRLAAYRNGGGYGFWPRDPAYLPLTAYAYGFLTQAREFVTVDEEALKETRAWLVKTESGTEPDALARAYQGVQAALALREDRAGLAAAAARFDDPYLIAAAATLAHHTGGVADRDAALDRLRALAQSERGAIYWERQGGTPFFGWGLAGQAETTALALKALAAAARPQDRDLIDGALLFLFRSKDRFGVWHSTQATIRVLEALLAAGGAAPAAGGVVEVLADGKPAGTLHIPESRLAGPLLLDVSAMVAAGARRFTLRRGGGDSPAQAQLAVAYAVPWNAAAPARGPLRMNVRFDKTTGRIGNPVTCSVEVERVGVPGLGMLLAEIGLPPGADVDRASLDDAAEVDRYEILPDRVILYLWPKAGGERFSFRFRPRFAMTAKTAPSVLYDYYNPDARVTVAPSRFQVAGSRR